MEDGYEQWGPHSDNRDPSREETTTDDTELAAAAAAAAAAQHSGVGDGEAVNDINSPSSTESASLLRLEPLPLYRDEPIVVPHTFDIMLGRGRGSSQHPGNQRFHLIVRMNIPRFQAASRTERTTLATEIVAQMKETGRFIRFNTRLQSWEVVDDRQAREKVDQAFRYHDRQIQNSYNGGGVAGSQSMEAMRRERHRNDKG